MITIPKTISTIEQASGGRLGVMACELGSGRVWAHHADERVPTASVIKLPLVIHAAILAHEFESGRSADEG